MNVLQLIVLKLILYALTALYTMTMEKLQQTPSQLEAKSTFVRT